MKSRRQRLCKAERGATLVEFSIAALTFFVALFSVLEIARMLWTYNALADAVRTGARYASLNTPNKALVKNVVVYGAAAPAQNAQPIVYGLTTNQVNVDYSEEPVKFGVRLGTVSVSVSGFSFQFLAFPSVLGTSLTFPEYKVSVTGESAGCVPGASC